jgi:hypothetical protein
MPIFEFSKVYTRAKTRVYKSAAMCFPILLRLIPCRFYQDKTVGGVMRVDYLATTHRLNPMNNSQNKNRSEQRNDD